MEERPETKIASGKLVCDLPDAIANVEIGGGGKYLFLHLPQLRQIAMFDIAQAKIVHQFPAADDSVRFAAGATKLVVVLGNSNVIQRWNLATKEREVAAPLPVSGIVKSVTMGSASQGPILMYSAKGTKALDRAVVDFLDLKTLQILPIDVGNYNRMHVFREQFHFRAAATGQIFGSWRTDVSPQGVYSFEFGGPKLKMRDDHTSRGHVIPGYDGRYLHTGTCLLTTDLKVVPGNVFAVGGGTYQTIPAVHGDYFLRLVPGPRDPRDRGKPGKLQANVYLPGDNRMLATYPDLELALPIATGMTQAPFPFDKRIIFLPDAKLIVTIPSDNRKVVLHRFDVEEGLEKSGLDFLFVTSQPPTEATPGTLFSYALGGQVEAGGRQVPARKRADRHEARSFGQPDLAGPGGGTRRAERHRFGVEQVGAGDLPHVQDRSRRRAAGRRRGAAAEEGP